VPSGIARILGKSSSSGKSAVRNHRLDDQAPIFPAIWLKFSPVSANFLPDSRWAARLEPWDVTDLHGIHAMFRTNKPWDANLLFPSTQKG